MRTATAGLILTALLLSLGACGKQDSSAASKPSLPLTAETGWLVVNYWATWCSPCREEIPELNALNASYKTSAQTSGAPDLVVVGVNYDAPDTAPSEGPKAQEALDAIASMGIQFDTISQSQAQQLGLDKPNSLPTTYLLRDNQLQHTLRGPQTAESIQTAINSR